jgi:hypothetical protein
VHRQRAESERWEGKKGREDPAGQGRWQWPNTRSASTPVARGSDGRHLAVASQLRRRGPVAKPAGPDGDPLASAATGVCVCVSVYGTSCAVGSRLLVSAFRVGVQR